MSHNPATIIIPAFNEEKAITEVIRTLQAARPKDEILVIDDASNDQTGSLAKKAGARVIRHPINMGYGSALKTGIRRAKYENLVFFDADGQHNPHDIEKLLEELRNSDMVVGARPKGSGALYRRSGKWVLRGVANYVAGRKIPDLNSGLRAIRRERALQFLHLLPDGFSLTTTITLAMMRSGFLVTYIPITARERIGKSTVSIKDFFRTLFLIVRITTLFAPLKIFMPIFGILLMIIIPSFIYDIIQRNITDTSVLIGITALVVFLFGLIADTLALSNRKEFRNIPDDFLEEG